MPQAPGERLLSASAGEGSGRWPAIRSATDGRSSGTGKGGVPASGTKTSAEERSAEGGSESRVMKERIRLKNPVRGAATGGFLARETLRRAAPHPQEGETGARSGVKERLAIRKTRNR